MHSLSERLAGPYSDQIERLWNEMIDEQSSVDATHPPTIYRFRFLEAHRELTAEFDANGADWNAIAAEIDPFLEPAGKALMDQPNLL